jgi:hypothetical protein
MPHSAEDIYLMVMTGGYRAADIERWAQEIAEAVAREVGMPVGMATMIQVGLPKGNFAITAGLLGTY